MNYDYINTLKQNHPALKLLGADNAPLIISFLFKIFVEPNVRALPLADLESRLGDYIFKLREMYGSELYPRSAARYLDDWASPEKGILRKYYPDLGDEPEFDLTPAAAMAIDWLQGLDGRGFVGTESRLLTVFDLLQDIVRRTEKDPELRIRELERKKQVIEREIEFVRSKGVQPHDPVQVKERFFQAEETARGLLADFRQIEYNFRALDRETRELIATSDKAKGELLDEIFRDNDIIRDSDQGRSFQSFWELLMSPERQQELQELLHRIYQIEEIAELEPDPFLARIKFFLLEAGEKVYKTGNQLVEQLRRFLDDQAWLENRRIMDIVKEIEKKAVAVKNNPPKDTFISLDTLKPKLELPMDRGLFSPPAQIRLREVDIEEGSTDTLADSLFEQVYVDEQELKANIRKALQTENQISLSELVKKFPLDKGLAELVAYLNLAVKDDMAVIDEEKPDIIAIPGRGKSKKVKLPKVIFIR
ncbi:MAG: DUF3375 domain-containing protein [Desulfobulbaceae bacterium]|nr:DUF3375 domain-containing protein [Desulfobulbaceae bacterium]